MVIEAIRIHREVLAEEISDLKKRAAELRKILINGPWTVGEFFKLFGEYDHVMYRMGYLQCLMYLDEVYKKILGGDQDDSYET